tara:strand:+ start:729 stop:1259 length:531 start_codon:yes stop_codon:yes gene_type:complete
MSSLRDKVSKNFSKSKKTEFERRVNELSGAMSEMAAIQLVLGEMFREGKEDGGIMSGDVLGKIDLMGDLSEEDRKTFFNLRKLLFSATIKDRPGYAQTMLEVLNPFDDKDADSRTAPERAREFDIGNKRLIYGIISTKDDSEARKKFIEKFTKNYENIMYPAGRMAEGGISKLLGE